MQKISTPKIFDERLTKPTNYYTILERKRKVTVPDNSLYYQIDIITFQTYLLNQLISIPLSFLIDLGTETSIIF